MNKNKTTDEVIKIINTKYPQLRAVPSEDFDGSTDGIWFKGTESSDFEGLPVLEDSMVNEKLDKFLNSLGFCGQPYDAGTLLAYRE